MSDHFIATFSGLRWTHNDHALSNVFRYTTSFAKNLPSLVEAEQNASSFARRVAVGRDGRNNGEAYCAVVICALLSRGLDVDFLDVVPTPTVQQYVQLNHLSGGVIITASHNPGNWNGLKFVGPKAIFLTPDECSVVYGDQVVAELDGKPLPSQAEACIVDINAFIESCRGCEGAEHDQLQACARASRPASLSGEEGRGVLDYVGSTEAIHQHLNKVLSIPFIHAQLAGIREAGLAIAFNGCNASGCTYIHALAERLGVKLGSLFNDTIGSLPPRPEPIPENLLEYKAFLQKEIAAGRSFDVAFAVDPDADRLVILDEAGKPIGEDLTLAIAVDQTLRSCAECSGAIRVCTNLSTSQVVETTVEALNECQCSKKGQRSFETEYTAVGEVNVALAMMHGGQSCPIGGEGNGGVMLRDAHLGRDSIVAIVLALCWIVGERARLAESAHKPLTGGSAVPLSSLIKKFRKFYIQKAKFEFVASDKEQLLSRLQVLSGTTVQGCEVLTLDGVKFHNRQKREWAHIRFSNTEPILRIITEAPSEQRAKELVEEYQKRLGL